MSVNRDAIILKYIQTQLLTTGIYLDYAHIIEQLRTNKNRFYKQCVKYYWEALAIFEDECEILEYYLDLDDFLEVQRNE